VRGAKRATVLLNRLAVTRNIEFRFIQQIRYYHAAYTSVNAWWIEMSRAAALDTAESKAIVLVSIFIWSPLMEREKRHVSI
jgi:hypothetical protein